MQLNWPATTSAPDLADNEAHAWAVPLVADAAARQALWSTLSADERKRADEFRFDHLRQRFVIAHGDVAEGIELLPRPTASRRRVRSR